MPEAPHVWPELPWSVDALLVLALRDRLQADALLAAILDGPDAGGILAIDRRPLLVASTLKAPLLAVTLRADEETLRTSSHGAVQRTLLELWLLTRPLRDLTDTGDFMRSRLAARIKRLIFAAGGEIYDERGRCLAKATGEVERVDFDEADLPSGLVPTVLRVSYETDIDHWTQEIEE